MTPPVLHAYGSLWTSVRRGTVRSTGLELPSQLSHLCRMPPSSGPSSITFPAKATWGPMTTVFQELWKQQALHLLANRCHSCGFSKRQDPGRVGLDACGWLPGEVLGARCHWRPANVQMHEMLWSLPAVQPSGPLSPDSEPIDDFHTQPMVLKQGEV